MWFSFDTSVTPIMEGILDFYNILMGVLYIIIFYVFMFFIVIYKTNISNIFFVKNIRELASRIFLTGIDSKVTHDEELEFIWTTIPAFILFFIAEPSLILLYAMDEGVNYGLSIKVIGHQWYWEYEYENIFLDKNGIDAITTINFDSYMVATEDLDEGFRLLQTDNEILIPQATHVRFLITSADVLHSWCVPSLGVKVDAVPGRINQVSAYIKNEGIWYGQCSELCGVNHGFMPITIRVVNWAEYIKWLFLR